jgi:hypothetical protein
MADLTNSEPYYDQISHAARPQTQYVTTTASAITGSFAGLVAITDAKFYEIVSPVTGMGNIASVTLANATTIPAGTYLAGDVSSFQIHSGVVLAIGD